MPITWMRPIRGANQHEMSKARRGWSYGKSHRRCYGERSNTGRLDATRLSANVMVNVTVVVLDATTSAFVLDGKPSKHRSVGLHESPSTMKPGPEGDMATVYDPSLSVTS